jgi:hypothetical protein
MCLLQHWKEAEMSVSSVGGRSVVESGSFTIGVDDREAIFGAADARFVFKVDKGATSPMAVSVGDEGATLITLRPHTSTQVSDLRSDWEADGRRFAAVFSIRGSAAGPGLLSSHLVSFTVTEG